MANNKTLRRQAAAAAAAEQAPNLETVEEANSDALDTSTDLQVQGSDVLDQVEGSLEGDQSTTDTAEGSDAAEGLTEQPEVLVIETEHGEVAVRDGAHIADYGLVGDESDGTAETLVSAEEQAASTAALLAQEPQPEPDAPTEDVKEDAGEPTEPVGELPPAEGGQEGADLNALEESAEDEQTALEAGPQVDPANSDPLFEEPAAPVSDDYTTWTTGQLRTTLTPAVGKDPAEAWSREEMLMYLIKGLYPQKTGRNNWIYDARRAHRVKAWTHSEILDFIEGKLKLDQHVSEDDAWEEAYARYKIPASWTIEAFREYVCNGSVPEYTASGVLINDRQRDQKQAGHLTFREIKAALLGHIQVQFTREELLTQYRKRLGIGTSYSEERLLAEMPNQPDEVSMDNTILRHKLDEYKSAITKNNGTQTEQTAGECQGMLYKAIREVIKREFNDFVEGWNIILDFVNDNYSTLFDPYKARRGWSQVPLGKSQLTLFEDLLTVIVATREPGNRAKKQTYNLEIVLRHLPEENQRQNLFMYYGAK